MVSPVHIRVIKPAVHVVQVKPGQPLVAGKTTAGQKVGLGGYGVGPVGKVTASAPGIVAVFVVQYPRLPGYLCNRTQIIKAPFPFPRRGKAWFQLFKEL